MIRTAFIQLLLGAILSSHGALAWATDYRSEFGAPSSNPGQTVVSGSGGTFRAWRSVGDPQGINVRNTSGSTIRGIHIKTMRETDRFTLPASFDNFFLQVWWKKNGREVIYNGGNILPGRNFFSKVSRTDNFPQRILDGKLSDTDISIENPEEWELVHDGTRDLNAQWISFLKACPSHFRKIDLYAVDKAGNICFLSKRRLYLYVRGDSEVHPVVLREALPANINRIATSEIDSQGFNIFHNESHLGRVPTAVQKGEAIEFMPADDQADGKVGRDNKQPAAKMPVGKDVTVNRVYFVRQKLFNLKARVFTQISFDTPNALAAIDNATFIGADSYFYYLRVTTFGSEFEWAFSIQPEGSFSGHTIWSRRAGETEWTQEKGEVVMAVPHS